MLHISKKFYENKDVSFFLIFLVIVRQFARSADTSVVILLKKKPQTVQPDLKIKDNFLTHISISTVTRPSYT